MTTRKHFSIHAFYSFVVVCCMMTVRVRFAPSPTGFLHLGGLRTALFNYLFARKNNGQFVLRIEDTDQNRLVPESMNNMLDVLKWVNLIPDEGPLKPEDYPKYVQSHRLDYYKEKANELVKNGAAYPCFCGITKIELMRKEALKNRQTYRYNNQCRNLCQQEVDDRIGEGQSFAIRYKLDPGFISYKDLIIGDSSVDLTKSEGDFVLFKSDQFPTYHLANVVDDHAMNITHVLRGSEWFMSTFKHIKLYQSFGWKHPEFGHLPVLLNDDGTKLSKRNEDFRVDVLRAKNYYPQVVVNFLVLTGGAWKPETLEIADISELTKEFSLDNLFRQNTKLSLHKLNVLNRFYMQNQIDNHKTEFLQSLRQYLVNYYKLEKLNEETDERLLFLFCEVPERFNCFGDFASEMEFVWADIVPNWDCKQFKDLKDLDFLCKELSDLIIEAGKASEKRLEKVHFIKPWCEKNGYNFKKVFNLIRLCQSNKKHGIPIGQMLFVLGIEEFVKRFRLGVEYTKAQLQASQEKGEEVVRENCETVNCKTNT